MQEAKVGQVRCRTSNNSVNTSGESLPLVPKSCSVITACPDIGLTFRELECGERPTSRAALTESLSRFHQLRKQSDLVLIRSVQEDTAHHRYFTRPPLHHLSCFFLDNNIECEYRRTAWKATQSLSSDYDPEPTFASSSFNAYIDIVVSAIVFVVISLSCLLRFGASPVWVVVCACAALYQLAVFCCVRQLLRPGPARSALHRAFAWCRRWYPSQVSKPSTSVRYISLDVQVFGAFLVSLPILSLFANLTCQNFDVLEESNRNFFMNLLSVSLIHFCNFTQVYCYLKSVLASLFAVSMILFHTVPSNCPCLTNTTTTQLSPSAPCSADYTHFLAELTMVIALLVVLIWMLNRLNTYIRSKTFLNLVPQGV